MLQNFSIPFTMDHQHPSLVGHFPGNPIVPGSVILDHIIYLWQEKQTLITKKEIIIKGINHSKFIHVLLADYPCNIDYQEKKSNQVTFVMSSDHSSEVEKKIICKGLFSYELGSEAEV